MQRTNYYSILCLAVGFLFILPQTRASVSDKPDFTGEWVLNEEKSTLGERMSFAAVGLTVTQDEGIFHIDRTRTGRDGQMRTMSEQLKTNGEKTVTERENGSTTSWATWSEDGTSLHIKYEITFSRQGETFTMNRSETWRVDEQGKVLTMESVSSSPRGENSLTLVYDKK